MEQVDTLLAAHEKKMTEGQKLMVESLSEEVESKIQDCESKAAFVRLSTLSPKDSTKSNLGLLRSLLIKELEEVEWDNVPQEIAAVNRVLYKACKVSSGKEAMDLILLSDRVYRMLKRRREEEKHFNMSLVVRNWVDFDPTFEFRLNLMLLQILEFFNFCAEDLFTGRS